MKRNLLWFAVFLFISSGLIIKLVCLYQDGKFSSNLTAKVSGNNISYVENNNLPHPISVDVPFRDSGKNIPFEYCDAFFLDTSTSYNHQLAQISLGMAISSFSSKDSDKFWGETGDSGRDSDIINFYKSSGFKNIRTYNYNKSLNSTVDSSAFAIAEKIINYSNKQFRLVALSVRGGAYGNEWVSNFNLGNTENHKGFQLSSDEIVKALYEYIGENTKNTKIWLTGYSRGGAIANITAAKISDDNKIKSENIFAYTFASPRGTLSKGADKYNNIFNILSENDIIPFLAPSRWGYRRYGKDIYFPTLSREGQNNQKITDIINEICTSIPSRIQYTDEYDNIFMDFIECNNTKIITEKGVWKQATAYEGFLNKYTDKENLLQIAKSNPFLKNAEKILGKTGEKIIVLGAICLVHGENPYTIIVDKIGIDNLSIIASILSGSSTGETNFAKEHSPENYATQLLSISSHSLIR